MDWYVRYSVDAHIDHPGNHAIDVLRWIPPPDSGVYTHNIFNQPDLHPLNSNASSDDPLRLLGPLSRNNALRHNFTPGFSDVSQLSRLPTLDSIVITTRLFLAFFLLGFTHLQQSPFPDPRTLLRHLIPSPNNTFYVRLHGHGFPWDDFLEHTRRLLLFAIQVTVSLRATDRFDS